MQNQFLLNPNQLQQEDQLNKFARLSDVLVHNQQYHNIVLNSHVLQTFNQVLFQQLLNNKLEESVLVLNQLFHRELLLNQQFHRELLLNNQDSNLNNVLPLLYLNKQLVHCPQVSHFSTIPISLILILVQVYFHTPTENSL